MRSQELPWQTYVPWKIPNEDSFEVRPITDAVVREEFRPCPNMFPYVDGEVLDDEVVIIHSSSSAGEPEVFEPYIGVRLPGVPSNVGGLVGCRKLCGNGAFWMR